MSSIWGPDSEADFMAEEARNERRSEAEWDYHPFCFVCGEQFKHDGYQSAVCDECADLAS